MILIEYYHRGRHCHNLSVFIFSLDDEGFGKGGGRRSLCHNARRHGPCHGPASIRVGPGRTGPAGPGRPAGPALIRPDRLCGDGGDAGDMGGRGDIGGQGRWRKYRRCRRYCRRYRRWRRRGGAASDPPRPAADLRPPRHAGLLRRECIPVTTTRSLCLGLRVS